MTKKNTRTLLISIGTALAAGGLSALLSIGSFGKYGNEIATPAIAPPAWVFPVVWTLLYILMGISAYIIYTSHSPNRNTALVIYGIQLVMNVVWTPIFFNAEAYLFAFVWLILLWVAILIMTVLFFTIDEKAGLLQIPYLLWVTFAGYLNYAVYTLNS